MSTITYHCSPDMLWVKQSDGTLLVNQATGQFWWLHDAAALVWDWLAVGYDASQIVRLLALTLALSTQTAETTLAGLLDGWQQAGILLDVAPGESVING